MIVTVQQVHRCRCAGSCSSKEGATASCRYSVVTYGQHNLGFLEQHLFLTIKLKTGHQNFQCVSEVWAVFDTIAFPHVLTLHLQIRRVANYWPVLRHMSRTTDTTQIGHAEGERQLATLLTTTMQLNKSPGPESQVYLWHIHAGSVGPRVAL